MRPGMELIVAGTLLGAALIILLLAVLAMLLTRKKSDGIQSEAFLYTGSHDKRR